MTDIQKILRKCTQAIRGAANPFIGSMNKKQLAAFTAAVRDALEFLGNYAPAPTIVKVEHEDSDGMLHLTLSMPPEIAMALVQQGLLCPRCMGTSTEEISRDDPEAYTAALNAGYHPDECRRCCNCGEYLRVL